MSDRNQILQEVIAIMVSILPKEWDPEAESYLSSNVGSHLIEEVVGAGVSRLLPDIRRMLVNTDTAVDHISVGYGTRLHVQGHDGRIFGVIEKKRDDRSELMFSLIDPEKPDYEYPEVLVYATVLDDEKYGFPHITTSRRNFDLTVEALRTFAEAAGLDLSPADASNAERYLKKYSLYNEIFAEDGLMPGELCMKAVACLNSEVAHLITQRLNRVFEETAMAVKSKGAVWPRGCLIFNDLDNHVSVVDGPRRTAIFHRNISYTSDWRGYALVREDDGNMRLYGVEDGSKDFETLTNAISDGKELPIPVVSFHNDEMTLRDSFDHAGTIGTAASGMTYLRKELFYRDENDSDLEVSKDCVGVSGNYDDDPEFDGEERSFLAP